MIGVNVKSIRFVLKVPLYEQSILFMLGLTLEQASVCAKGTGCSDSMADYLLNLKSCVGVSVPDPESGYFVVYMQNLPRTAAQHGSLVHELFHVTEQILKAVGMKHKVQTSSEAYAYLIGWLANAVFESVWDAVHAKPLSND